jgi:hypothetical protein
MNDRLGRTGGALWAITSYYNPIGYHRRPENYRLFRQRLNLPLVTAELGYGGAFELGRGDADILIQRPAVDVLWQKERLLNVALAALPPSCTKVVWIDCDVFFTDPGWAEALERLLDDAAVVQPFARVNYLSQAWTPADREYDVEFSRQSLAAGIADGLPLVDCMLPPVHDRRLIKATGFAWAARRALLDRHGIYDAAIIGGGDRLFAGAACDFLESGVRVHLDAPSCRDHYLRWAAPFARDAGGRIGVLDLDLFNLWHGEMANRRARERFVGLAEHGYDPETDIAIDTGGGWRWNSDKPALHRYVRDYFIGRREDG